MEDTRIKLFFIGWLLVAIFATIIAGIFGFAFCYLFTGFIIWGLVLEMNFSFKVVILWMPAIMSEKLLERWFLIQDEGGIK